MGKVSDEKPLEGVGTRWFLGSFQPKPSYEPVIMAFLYDLRIFLKDISDFTSSLMNFAKSMAQQSFVSGSNRESVHHEDNLFASASWVWSSTISEA